MVELEAVFLNLLEISAASAVVILAMVLLSSLINRSFTAKWKYWLWMVLAIRLLVPFNLSFDAAPAKVEVNIPNTTITIPAPAATPAPPVQPASPAPVTVPSTQPAEAARVVSTVDLLIFVWLCGVVLFILWQLASYLRFRRQVERWGLPMESDSVTAIVRQQVEAEFDIQRKIPALICRDISSPMMIGFFRPLLLLPQERYNAQDLSYILRHELTHYSRRDIWYKALLLLANAVHWFNPAVWLMVREASRDLEISCDAAVMKNASMDERRTYSEIILSCVHRELKMKTALSTHFYGGKKALKERFANIPSTKKRRAGVIAFAVVALCGGIIGGLVVCGTDKRYPPEIWARQALTELLTVTVDQAEEFYALPVPTPAPGDVPGITSAPEDIDRFFIHLCGNTITEECRQNLIADRVFTRIAGYVLEKGREVSFAGVDFTERAGAKNLYNYTARLTSNDDPVGEAVGTIQMVKNDDNRSWSASRISVTITFNDAEPAPQSLPIPTLNLQPGRIYSLWDPPQVGLNTVREVKGTQAELDRWNAAIRDPAIVRLDFNNMQEQSMLLPVEQELEILTALWNAQVRLYEGNPDPSTGGGCSVIAYDGQENPLFQMAYVGDLVTVRLPGEEVSYYFDGEGTSLDDLLRSSYGIPLPQSIILRETTPLDYELWGILIDDPEEVALVTSLLSTQYLTPSAPDEAFWTDGGTPISFELDYGDHTVTGACDPNQRRSEYDPSGSRLSTGGIMYNYPHETGIQLLAFLDSKGIDMGSWWKDYITRSVAFQMDLESVDGESVGGFMDFTLQMPASWTVSTHNDIYDGEGLLTAEVLPWIWDTGGTAFDRLAEKYPNAELVDASIGDLTGKRFTLQTPVEGMTAVNNEIYYYLRWSDYLIGIKFHPKAGIGGIQPQREDFESRVRIIPSLYPGPVPGPDNVSVPVPDHAGDPNWPLDGDNPDFGPYDNPDTSQMYSEEENAAWQREFAFYGEVLNGFPQGLPKESYSYYTTYGEGTGNDMQLVLEIGVIDEAAVDNFLASWTGMKWDKLVKKPGTISQAEQEAFCEKVEQLDLGPNVYIDSRPEAGLYGGEMGKILVSISLDLYASQEEVARWQEMPQAIKDFAAENGIPENMLGYMAPRYTPPGSNPDT